MRRGALERRLAALEQVAQRQREELDTLRCTIGSGEYGSENEVLDRRAVLRRTGLVLAALTGGAATVVAVAQPAHAANGDSIKMGQTTTGTLPTVAVVSGFTTTGFALSDDPNFTPQLPALDTAPPTLTVTGS